jgi:serine/threonine protein phosphatase PrpC
MSTAAGIRKSNEDFCGFVVSPDHLSALIVLADGMGGHASGEVASRLATETLLKQFELKGFEQPEEVLREAIFEAHERIAQESSHDTEKEGMGTTIVAALAVPEGLVVGHVGDSRAYQFRLPNVRRLTEDHLYVVEVLGLDENVAKSHPKGHILAQALGIEGPMEPTIARFDVSSGDVVLLCCDGVSEYLTEVEMCGALAQAPLQDAVARMVQLAIEKDSRDNCTAIAALIP